MSKPPNRPMIRRCALAAALVIPILASVPQGRAASEPPKDCSSAATGIVLAPGFCATVFADNIGHARHLAVAPSGTVYVNTWSGRYYHGAPVPAGGFLVALTDQHGTGRADLVRRFGPTQAEGAAGGTGIALFKGALYAEANDKVVRYELPADGTVPKQKPSIVLSGLPLTGDHPMHPFVIDRDGGLLIDLGSATNSCQDENRVADSPGQQPCKELETRGGTWRYDANKAGQRFSAADRYATGIRNGEGLAFDGAGQLYTTQHGRDQLAQNWPGRFNRNDGAELPAEELLRVERGSDYGWPYCYYDPERKSLMLAPEYGGDGNTVGLCAKKVGPLAAFPAHWAPNDMVFSTGRAFPPAFRGGAFIAFHGSWNRAPKPQGGYNVVYQPMADGKASGEFIVFADGFAGAIKEPGRAAFRPTGLAFGPDGALYISDDVRGRVWRVTYAGAGPGTQQAQAEEPAAASAPAAPPEGSHPDAGRPDPGRLPVPAGAAADDVALGDRIFHGEAGEGTCSGCHGSDGHGTSVGPDLTGGSWLWGDGSLDALARTIAAGVAHPKHYPGLMPPKGGSALSDGDVRAVAAYVWAIGHDRN